MRARPTPYLYILDIHGPRPTPYLYILDIHGPRIAQVCPPLFPDHLLRTFMTYFTTLTLPPTYLSLGTHIICAHIYSKFPHLCILCKYQDVVV